MKPFYRQCIAVLAGFVVFMICILIMAWVQTSYHIKPGAIIFIINIAISIGVYHIVNGLLRRKYPTKEKDSQNVD